MSTLGKKPHPEITADPAGSTNNAKRSDSKDARIKARLVRAARI